MDKPNVYPRDMHGEMLDETWKRFENALLHLDSAGKLGVVLFQFPPWFFPGDEQRDYILSCKKRLPPVSDSDRVPANVGILNLVLVAAAFGSTPASPHWNAAEDLNHDGVVNIFDLVKVGLNCGK